MYTDIAVLAACIFLFRTIAGRVEKNIVSGPIIFIVVGFLLGPMGFEILSFKPSANIIRILAELTLAIVLFNDAAGSNLSVLRKGSAIPTRMLIFGLPLVLLLGIGGGFVLFGNSLSLVEIAILATLLAPTDAALGQSVLKNNTVPSEIRQGLNAESGLNDGLCVPILFVFLIMATGESHDLGIEHLVLILFAEELGLGLLVGVIITAVAWKLISYAGKSNNFPENWSQLTLAGAAVTSFSAAQSIGGSGFIAAFCGGLLFGYLAKEQRHQLLSSSEGIGELFSMITWILFGALICPSIQHITWQMVCYAVLSLTVIRMLPIFVSLIGSKVSIKGRLFLGWFGPRGMATIVFTVIVMDSNLPSNSLIVTTAALTIVSSVFLHGLTATPWANRWKE